MFYSKGLEDIFKLGVIQIIESSFGPDYPYTPIFNL